MSGVPSQTFTEATGSVAPPAGLEKLCVVFGCSSTGSGLSTLCTSGKQVQDAFGYGDGPDVTEAIIEQKRTDGSNFTKIPAWFYKVPTVTAGSYGTLDDSGVTGTAIPVNDSTLVPRGTYEARIDIVEGGTVGTTGISYTWSLSDGRQDSNTVSLGVATTISIPNAGVGFELEPSAADVVLLIAFAVEARSDTLAHLADAVAHDGADTSAAQIALNASSVPTTGAQAWAVLNLCRTALASHQSNITVHNGPDGVNTVAHAAATNESSGTALAIEYRADYNAHLGIALAASTAGLLAATASSVAVQTYLTAGLLAPGLALMATYARRVTFTTAGGTASDAPATATIIGTDYLGAAQTEVVNVPQTATIASSVGAYKTITSIVYSAGDGTGATVAIGYGQAVHNSADSTNTIAAAAPVMPTLNTGDSWTVRTIAPQPSSAGLATAFEAVAASTIKPAIVVLDFPVNAALAATVSTGLSALEARGKRCGALIRTRIPDAETSESDLTWVTSVNADYVSFEDDRITVVAAYGYILDAMTRREYMRSFLSEIAANFARVGLITWAGSPADNIGGMQNVRIADDDGVTIGHDEGPRNLTSGDLLSNDTAGNRFLSVYRDIHAEDSEAVYTCVPWTMYAEEDRIRNFMTRRLATQMERVTLTAGVQQLGSVVDYIAADPGIPGSLPTLSATSRTLVHALIFGPISQQFGGFVQNGDDGDPDTGIVQVTPYVTVTGGNLVTISGSNAPKVKGYVLKFNWTLSVQQ